VDGEPLTARSSISPNLSVTTQRKPYMHDFLIGRQQILDRDLATFGYELLFRHVADSLLEHGLERIIGPHVAFINFTRENLLSEVAWLLPKDRVVIEIVEDIVVDEAVVEVVRQLGKEGYTIALDDFVFSENWLPLIRLAKIIKLDVQQTPLEKCRDIIARLAEFPLRFLAEKVETAEQFQAYYDLGCHYFQGFWFSRPSILKGKRLEANQLGVLQLLAKINDPDAPFDECAETISLDVTLSYKLLRYINSVFFSLPRKIDSLRYAVTFLGFREVRRWTSLLLLSDFSDRPREIVNLALVRARMCESLATLGRIENSDHFFLVGLLSTIDRLLNMPLEEALAGLPFSEAVRDALLSHGGPAGEALACVINYEHWRHEEARFANLTPAEIGRVYLESVAWAYEAFKALGEEQN
jgi:EAL and modified HD-GYP domain-containing signal transduction protein